MIGKIYIYTINGRPEFFGTPKIKKYIIELWKLTIIPDGLMMVQLGHLRNAFPSWILLIYGRNTVPGIWVVPLNPQKVTGHLDQFLALFLGD